MADVLLIAGSPALHSRSAAVLHTLSARLETAGLSTTLLRVRDLPAEALLHAQFNDPEIVKALDHVQQAAALIVATPVYKASFSGILKAFLDLLPQNGLESKLVLPVATGGSSAHLLALEYALKPVLAALGAQTFLPSLYVQDSQILQTDPPQFDADIERRLLATVTAFSAQFNQKLLIQGAFAS
jgi:FMN reductase